MSLKRKRIKDLYFRFIKDSPLDGTVDAKQVFKVLTIHRLIEPWPNAETPSHYIDSPKLRALPKDSYHRVVVELLKEAFL